MAVVHRRAGKSTAFVWRALRRTATEDRRHLPPVRRNLRNDPPRVVHVLPEQVMWKRTGLWDKVDRAAKAFPGARVYKSELKVLLPNGGVYQCGGMDKPDKWRGGYADELIEDEADDVIADTLDMVVQPMLTDYQGTRVRIGTPKGNGRLADAYDRAGEDPNADRFLLPWQKTEVFSEAEVNTFRKSSTNPEGLDEEEFAQEYECSFTAPNAGSYYGKWLDAAVREDRIRQVPYDPALPVYTAWDLGIDDSTAIWWFQRSSGGEWRWLEYFEDSGQGLDYYVRILKDRPYTYGRHYLPHDIENRELTFGGKSRRQFLEGLNIRPIKVVPAANPAERVQAARSILPRSFFDAKGCEKGLKYLRAYRRSWNEHMGVWRPEPLHDFASHCFAGETKVLTRYGTHQIMDLPETGEVLTSCGWKQYRNPRVTRTNAPLVEVRFTDGFTVKCTPDHLFRTGSGWRSASRLRKGSLIRSSLTRSLGISEADFIDCGQPKSTSHAAADDYTEMYGFRLLERSRRVATSIIATRIQKITNLRTWSACLPLSTARTAGKLLTATGGTPKLAISLPAHERPPLAGTHPKKVGFGIVDTPALSKAGKSGRDLPRFVFGAIRSFLGSAAAALSKNTAVRPAKWLVIDSVKKTNETADVWCLTVPDAAEFSLSNGAIVHNCADAFGTGVQGSKSPEQENKPRSLPAPPPPPRHWLGR